MANNYLKWEKTKALNIGLDFSLLNDHLSGTIDYYDMATNDLLLARSLPTIIGQAIDRIWDYKFLGIYQLGEEESAASFGKAPGGDIPFLNIEHAAPKIDFYTHSRKTILAKIIDDMNFAVKWLPETAIPGAVTQGAGYHLFARILLADGQFEEAV